jgi:hypothetical protein
MYTAKVYYEGIEIGDRIQVLSDEFEIGADGIEEARRICNRVTKRGFRLGRWFIPAHRIISVYLKEVKNE